MLTRAGINVIIDRVTKIDPKGKRILLADTGEMSYDKLVLGMGSRPIVPRIKGSGLEGVFTPYSLDHAEDMRRFLTEKKNHGTWFS